MLDSVMTNQQIADRNIKVHYTSNFVHSLLFLIPVWVAYELQYISLYQIPLIEAIIQGSQLFLELPTGALADLWGKRVTTILGYAIVTIGAILFALSRSYEAFILYALVAGLGSALVSGARDAWLYDSLKAANREEDYTKIASKGSLIQQFALAIATITGGILGTFNILYPIIATAIAAGVTTIIFLYAKEPSIDTEKFTFSNYLRQTKMGIKEITRSKHILAVSLFYIAVGGITWASMMVFNATLMTEIGFTALEFGITLASIRIINSFILFGALRFNKVFNQHSPFLFITAVMIVSYLPGIFLTKLLTVFAISGSIFSSTFRYVVLGKLVNQEYSSKNRATAISTLSMAVSIIVVMLTLISGPIMANFGGIQGMFTFMGILTLLFIFPLSLRLNGSTANSPVPLETSS
jgi:MFS family permease